MSDSDEEFNDWMKNDAQKKKTVIDDDEDKSFVLNPA